ncbi:peptidase PqqG, involved in biosynthesis of pyrroloquinoline quinone [gamma proteobacterium HTCC5015]|nr:peptidase PqqG, involved in biosynthesis of pyrroloquinoline quinone [gamma proteobacterium HTCC5015]
MNRWLMKLSLALVALGFVSGAQAVEIQHWTTDEGARVYFYPAHSIPMLDVRVVFDAGSARDKRSGTAAMTQGLLDMGAGEWDANAIAEQLESVGAQLGGSVGRDSAALSLRSLTDESRLDAALTVFTKVLSQPTFPQADFEREQARLIQALRQQKQQPGAQVGKAYYRALYGDHPYAAPSSGDEESVSLIRRVHLFHFHKRYYVANNAVIALVGDVDRARAEAVAARISSQLREGEAAPELPEVVAPSASQQRIEMDTQQSHILMGLPAVRRGGPDYYALYVGNHIFGGSGFAARLMQRIREDRGLAYSVYSRLSPMSELGPFTMGMQTRNEQREEAIDLLRSNLREFIQEGPTEEELQKSLDNIIGSEALRTDKNAELVRYLAMIGFYELPLDYLDTFSDKVREVSRDDVKAAWQRHIDPDNLVQVVVGASVEAAPEKAPTSEAPQ